MHRAIHGGRFGAAFDLEAAEDNGQYQYKEDANKRETGDTCCRHAFIAHTVCIGALIGVVRVVVILRFAS